MTSFSAALSSSATASEGIATAAIRRLTALTPLADAVVVGPVATLEQGLDIAENQPLDAAVLDVNLAGERAFEIADRLSARDVPWTFLTGYDEWALPAPYRSASIVAKPFQPDRIIRAIGALIPDKGCA